MARRRPSPPHWADHGKVGCLVGVHPLYDDHGGVQLQRPGNAGWPTQPHLLHDPPGPTLHEPALLAAQRGQAGQGYLTPPASPGRPTTMAVLPPDIIRGDQPQPHLISHPYKSPTHVFRSDAAEQGTVRFCGLRCNACSLKLPPTAGAGVAKESH